MRASITRVFHLLPRCSQHLPSCNYPLRSVSCLSQSSPELLHIDASRPFSRNLYCPVDFDKEFGGFYDLGVRELVQVVKECDTLEDAVASLELCTAEATTGLVCSAIWALKKEWKASFAVFIWGHRLGCDVAKAVDLIIWVLGNHGKFNTAWCVIRDLHRSSVDCQRAMSIMMDRYAAANDPSMSIRTFWIMDKFRISYDIAAFHTLLNILCAHGYVEEAEELMLIKKKIFPLETESFNIILNGWCNVSPNIIEAKRVWRAMAEYCITPNASSYTHMISCFSKVGNLFDSVRLYDEMKKRGWIPSIAVYNSLIYILAHEHCFEEAFRMLNRVRDMGLQPDSLTFENLIQALCRTKRNEDAKTLLDDMKNDGVDPRAETYHPFLEHASLVESMEVLDRMRSNGCDPHEGTFLLLLKRFFKLNEVDNAMKVWFELKRWDLVVNAELYGVLIEGLISSGILQIARGFHMKMTSNRFRCDPKLLMLLRVEKTDKYRRRES